MDYAELVKRMRSWSGTHDVADAIEALIRERDELRLELISAYGQAQDNHARGYREGLEKAAQIADGEAHADCDVAEQIAKFIRALIPE